MTLDLIHTFLGLVFQEVFQSIFTLMNIRALQQLVILTSIILDQAYLQFNLCRVILP